MNEVRNSRFTSYIEEFEDISLNEDQKTKLLNGEVLVCEASKVQLFAPLSGRKQWKYGVLSITTFKMSFVCPIEKSTVSHQKNFLLGPNEVCMSSIDTVYQVGERSRKKLHPGQTISNKIKELQIICKNMRTFHFSFKYADRDSGKNIATALLHHMTPNRSELLFAFEYKYKEPSYTKKTQKKNIQLFRTSEDWQNELIRTCCKNWRITKANENFDMSSFMPRIFVVPHDVSDNSLENATRHFKSRFCPVWVWGMKKESAALVRMADLDATIPDRTQENIMFESIRKSHGGKKTPVILDLTRDCPSAREIQSSFVKLRELCVPDNIRLFKTQDSKFYSLLEGSRWLLHVSICLTKALEASRHLYEESLTVVLQEGDGRDMNCVISSLTQLILDPYWRTTEGFQSLIQKEWIVLGHRFMSRLGFIHDNLSEPAPYFLLFLDCVWQLIYQYPTAFKFSETYLTTLWDSTNITIFDTFVFNCESERYKFCARSKEHKQLSIWDWNKQFSEKDQIYFCNPLYDSFNHVLKPKASIPFIEVWSQCYFRWIPNLEIRTGGSPQIFLSSKVLVTEIYILNQIVKRNAINEITRESKEELMQLLGTVGGFFPFSRDRTSLQCYLGDSDLSSMDGLDSHSLLNLNND